MQLSKLCGQEIMLVVYDRNLSKITQYRSNELFDVSACHRLFEKAQAQNSIYSGNPKPNIGADIELQVFNYTNRDFKKFLKKDKGENQGGSDIDEEIEQEEIPADFYFFNKDTNQPEDLENDPKYAKMDPFNAQMSGMYQERQGDLASHVTPIQGFSGENSEFEKPENVYYQTN